MASGENQGLQIALIILFILVIGLSLSSFFFFKESQDWKKQATSDSEKAAAATQSAKNAQDELNTLKQYIGMPIESDLKAMQDAHQGDMAKYAGTLPAEKQFYRQALEELFSSLSAAKAAQVAAETQVKLLQDSNAKFEETRKQEVAAAIAEKDKAVKDLADERAKFMDGQKKADEEKKDALARHEEAIRAKDEELDKIKKDLEALQKDLARSEVKVVEQSEELRRLRGQTLVNDDGEIRWVNARSRVVWINLGRGDNLRRQVVFEVHGADAPANDASAMKGKIEVTQILGEHLAEARILDDDIRNPLVPGDKIYTSLWDASRPERFAIVGKIDLDGDGRNDLERVKNLIEGVAGGKVDAWLDDDGKKTGEITVDTRYLIEGPVSSGKSGTPHKLMVEDARKYGVEVIGVDRFLDNIGWRSTRGDILRYGGTDANAESYPPPRPDGGAPRSPGTTTDLFKTRLPPKRPASAY